MRSGVRLIAAAAALTLIISAGFAGCRHGDSPEPANTGSPSALVTETAEATLEPGASVGPGYSEPAGTDAAASASPTALPPGVTAGPDSSANPTENPGATDGATAQPAVSGQPGVTARPTGQGGATNPPAPATALPTASPNPTARPTPSPAPIATATPRPTNTPKPDPVTALTWLELDTPVSCDMDFDGKAEKVELTRSESGGKMLVSLKVTNGKTGKVLMDSVTCDRFVKGLINNFNTGDRRVEVMLSVSSGTRDDVTHAYRLNSGSTGLLKCSCPGLVESVNGSSLQIARMLDLLGTWNCTASYAVSYDKFELVRSGSDWIVTQEEDRWCTSSTDFIAAVYLSGTDNSANWFGAGEKLRPVSTDLESRMDFVTDTGTRGYFDIDVDENGRVTKVNGYAPTALFGDLNYID